MEKLIENIFREQINIKKTGATDIYRLSIPVYHRDGDMLLIYIKNMDNNKFEITDFGNTLQRLAHFSEFSETFFNKITADFTDIKNDYGILSYTTNINNIVADVFHFFKSLIEIETLVRNSIIYKMYE